MSELKCGVFSYLRNNELNGGYAKVGDGNMKTCLFLEKGGVKLNLEDEDIVKLMKCLRGINPTIKVS